jgi:mono/diheme cytochrome c family protein
MIVRTLQSLGAAAALLLASGARAEPPKKTPELLEKGKASFAKNCVSCHGPKGEGNGMLSKSLKPPPRNLVTEPLKNGGEHPAVEQVFETLKTGSKGTAMVAFTGLPEEERWALAHYVISLRDGAGNK